MKKIFTLIPVLLLCLLYSRLQSQVLISENLTAGHLSTVDDLWKVLLVNSGPQPVSGVLEIRLQSGSNLLLLIESGRMVLPQGSSLPDNAAISQAVIQYGAGSFSQNIRETGRLPYGSINLCYRFKSSIENTELAISCGEVQINPLLPPELIMPEDKAVVCQPVFSWTAPYPPESTPFSYKFKLCKINEKQTPEQALRNNFAQFERPGLSATMLAYPADALPLVEGQEYAWQVTVYVRSRIVAVTDVRHFSNSCGSNRQPEIEVEEEIEFFRLAKRKMQGSPFFVDDTLRFAFKNILGEEKLTYSMDFLPDDTMDVTTIIDIDNPINPPTDTLGGQINPILLPELTLHSGINEIELPLMAWNIPYDEPHILIIKDNNDNLFYIEFIRKINAGIPDEE